MPANTTGRFPGRFATIVSLSVAVAGVWPQTRLTGGSALAGTERVEVTEPPEDDARVPEQLALLVTLFFPPGYFSKQKDQPSYPPPPPVSQNGAITPGGTGSGNGPNNQSIAHVPTSSAGPAAAGPSDPGDPGPKHLAHHPEPASVVSGVIGAGLLALYGWRHRSERRSGDRQPPYL